MVWETIAIFGWAAFGIAMLIAVDINKQNGYLQERLDSELEGYKRTIAKVGEQIAEATKGRDKFHKLFAEETSRADRIKEAMDDLHRTLHRKQTELDSCKEEATSYKKQYQDMIEKITERAKEVPKNTVIKAINSGDARRKFEKYVGGKEDSDQTAD